MSQILDEIRKIAKELGINKDMIRHVFLSNGTEFIGESLPIEVDQDDKEMRFIIENEETFFHPLKIEEDNFISSDGSFQSVKHFQKYNQYSSEPYVPINKIAIVSKSYLNETMLLEYLKSVHRQYFGYTEVSIETKDNIVSFMDFKSKKER